jgi:hypothetical protein
MVALEAEAQGAAFVLFSSTGHDQPVQAALIAPGRSDVLDIRTGRTGMVMAKIDTSDEFAGGSIQIIVDESVIVSATFRGDSSFTCSVDSVS